MKKLLFLAVAITMALSMVAHADGLPSETDYFHCDPNGSTPLINVNVATDDNRPSWNATAPTASIVGGARCGAVSGGTFSGANYKSVYDLMAAGPYTGNIDSLTVTFYAAFVGPGDALFSPVPPPVLPDVVSMLPPEPTPPSPAPALPPYPATPQAATSIQAAIHVGVDGISMFGSDSGNTTGSVAPSIARVDLQPIATSTPGIYKFEYTVTGLNFLSDDSAEHDVELTANVWSELFGAYPIDTVETPASVTFNPETPAAAVLRATTPNKD